ncbi:hypothetical protein, partial [Klebsiella pneumoniae]|uniref:hypothetical protein n=1 Tax=Klebsiella pneumoniae TaxID=573 RepID=UPI0025A0946D
MKAVDRGYEIEKSLGGMANNFPTIDKYVSKLKNGINMISSATSIKSIDITASSYQKSSKLKSKLKGYVDDLAKFSS